MRVEKQARGEGWAVRLAVALDRGETNELFLAGDKLIAWPTAGMLASGAAPVERSSMFLSEIVSRVGGLELLYRSEELADRVGRILAHQVRSAFEGQ